MPCYNFIGCKHETHCIVENIGKKNQYLHALTWEACFNERKNHFLAA